ncbi:MAG: hypothetical protein JNJ77_20080 [Planctomycetia bacterium]|nr:hypothetical protein [Planctomycetia bacterium]
MSMHALLLAVRNFIRAEKPTGLAYPINQCELGPPNGQPPPNCGPCFVTVHEGSSIGGEVDYAAFNEIFSVNVTVTIRLRGTPWDRHVQKELYGPFPSLESRCDQIAALIHRDTYDHRVINAANALDELEVPAEGYAKQGFVEPLRYAGTDIAKEVGPAWFHGHIDAGHTDCGWIKVIRFTGARRIQETLFAQGIGEVS